MPEFTDTTTEAKPKSRNSRRRRQCESVLLCGCWFVPVLVTIIVGIDVLMLSPAMDMDASHLTALELWLDLPGSTTPSIKLALKGTLATHLASSSRRHGLFIDTARCVLAAERRDENLADTPMHDELNLGDAVVTSGLPLELMDHAERHIELIARDLDLDAVSRIYEDTFNDNSHGIWQLQAACKLDVRVHVFHIPYPRLALRSTSSYTFFGDSKSAAAQLKTTASDSAAQHSERQRSKLLCVAVESQERALTDGVVSGLTRRAEGTLGWLRAPLEALSDYTFAPFESAAVAIERGILSRTPITFRNSCRDTDALIHARVVNANAQTIGTELRVAVPHWLNRSMPHSLTSLKVNVPALEIDVGRTAEPKRVTRLRESISVHGVDHHHDQDDYDDITVGALLALRSSATTLELIGGNNVPILAEFTCADAAHRDEKCAFGLVQPFVGVGRQVFRDSGAQISMLPAAALTQESVVGWFARCGYHWRSIQLLSACS